MPMPIAHSAFGLGCYLVFGNAFDREASKGEKVLLAGFCVAVANVPDLDFVPGILIGDPGRFHHGPSHSIAAALVGGLLLSFLLVKVLRGRISSSKIGICCLCSLLIHPILDCFSMDSSEPYGVPLLWPFTETYFISPVSLFLDVQRDQTSVRTFLDTLINPNNVRGAIVELFFSGMVLLLVLGVRVRSRPALAVRSLGGSLACGLIYAFLHFR
jgi:hypothetical protein